MNDKENDKWITESTKYSGDSHVLEHMYWDVLERISYIYFEEYVEMWLNDGRILIYLKY